MNELFKIFILPTLLYGVCTYPLTQARVDRIRGATTRMLKKAYNISPLEHVSIEELYQQGDVVIDLAPVQLFRQRMKLIGSGLRNSDTTLHKIFMICNVWNSYHTNINTTIMEHFPEQMTPQKLLMDAQDVEKWELITEKYAKEIHLSHLEYIKNKSENSRVMEGHVPLLRQPDKTYCFLPRYTRYVDGAEIVQIWLNI